MNYIDILISIPLLYALYKGWTKGLIVEVATLAALLLGIFLAVNYSDYTKEILSDKLEITTSYLGYIAFIVTFIVVVFLINLLGRFLTNIIRLIALGTVNRILGALFSMGKTILILCLLISLFERFDNKVHLVNIEKKQKSKFYYPIHKVAGKLNNSFHMGDVRKEVKKQTDKLK